MTDDELQARVDALFSHKAPPKSASEWDKQIARLREIRARRYDMLLPADIDFLIGLIIAYGPEWLWKKDIDHD